MTSVENVLKQLGLEPSGAYDNQFYVIQLEDSDDWARMYSKLDGAAKNTENPSFGVNSSNNTTKVVSYFSTDCDSVTYNLFLIADYENDKYYLKIGER